ncbi:MAG TPA: hypothetical protein VMA74_21385 [Dyella sp.]|uniref:hypothetical protein n=1 Tax=Dyella sp. TaxID=1869338 RepID=UPI002BC0B66B|nr:hypothetical protein [Dyella sp.]HUB92291.1 hypothetical protein [Dyella sp.]
MRKYFLFIVMLMFFGVASAAENYVAPSASDLQARPGYARVFIYRSQASIGRYGFGYGVASKLKFNDKLVTGLKQNEFTVIFLRPGTYTVASANHSFWNGVKDVTGTLTVSENNNYYLRIYGDVVPPTSAISNVEKAMTPQTGWWYDALTLTPEQQGEEVVSRCIYKPPMIAAIP